MNLIVTVDGKSFYADITSMDNWNDAANWCKLKGYQLASITSREQYLALNASYSRSNFVGSHWTAGRDAMTLEQFTWNGTEISPSSDYLPYEPFRYDPTCLMFASNEGESLMMSNLCNTRNIYALCETISANV